MQRSKTPEEFIAAHPQWQALLNELRDLLCSTELEETIKWGVPVYTLGGKNVVGLTAFKQHAALWFHQGALLKDPAGCLVNAQEGKTVAQRQWRFGPDDAVDREQVLAYVGEAIDNQRRGRAVKPAPKRKLEVPPELSAALDGDGELAAEFEKLAPYKQREYAEFIASAKQAATKLRRLEKILPMISAGKGLNDHYRC